MGEQLNKEQYLRKTRTERWTAVIFSIAVAIVVIMIASSYLFNTADNTELIVWVTIIFCIMLLGVVVRLSERCPKCGQRIGMQTKLTRPKNCKNCGVSFKKPEEGT
jgi:hypothetical protein